MYPHENLISVKGITISNKWLTEGPVEGIFSGPKIPSLAPLDRQWKRLHPEIPEAQRRRLEKLAVGLHATLLKDPTLDDGTFKIFVGD